MYMIDSRIMPYLDALQRETQQQPISVSHNTLRGCYTQHGQDTFDELMAAHWATERIIAERRMYVPNEC